MTKNASSFKYFRSEIQEEGETERDINRKLATSKRTIEVLNSMLWSRDIILNPKKIIYNTIFESI